MLQAIIALLMALLILQPYGIGQAGPQLIREHSMPLRTETTASTADLAFLDEFVDGARVVAIGEGTHGAQEFFELKHRMIRYLVESHGFTILAIEDNIPAAGSVNRYVTKGEGEASEVIQGLFGVSNTEEVLRLIEWLRLHNSTSNQQVQFHGLDIQAPGASANEVLEFLEVVDLEYLVIARELYRPAFEMASAWNRSTFGRVAPTLLDNGQKVLDHLVQQRTRYARSASQGEIEWALRNARSIVQFGQKAYANMPSRDESMAKNVLSLLEQNPRARMIIWAHNGHVMESTPQGFSVEPPMGQLLAETLGKSYRSLGFVYAQGRNRAYDTDSQSWMVHELPLLEFTVGGQLQSLGEQIFFLDLRGLEDEPMETWLGEVQPFRWVGWSPISSITRLIPTDAFDGLLFIENISPAQRLIPTK